MFKVVADQLRISEGWVRCGQCAEIFDATANLQEPEGVAAQVPSPAVSPPRPPPVAAAQPPTAPLATPPSPVAVQTVQPTADAPDSIVAPPLYPWFPSEVHDSQLPRESGAAPQEADLDSVSFVRKARRRALWDRPVVRFLLVLVMLLLAGSLTLQYAAQERDKLATLQPALLPWLQRLCVPLRCEVRPPRQIDAIVIESSSFNRLRSDAYRLSFSLRNQAAMQVAMPSLELTLTDSQDQPLIRSVLAPHDIGAPAILPASGESNSTVAVSVTSNGSNRIAGYRLLAFYP